MATIRQKKLAAAIVENFHSTEPLNKQELLVSAGYDQTTAQANPGKIIEQKGTQLELHKLGFDSANAKRVVGEILNKEFAEDTDRLKAAKLIFEVNGDMAPEKHLIVTKKILSIDE